MADKSVGELIAAQSVTPTDLFVLEQNGTAKKLAGQVLENWLVSFADGHGGIQSIQKLSTIGLVDTYRITLADTTTFDFTVTNGKSITGIAKTGSSGLVDTYKISYNDGTIQTYTVTNGAKGDKGDNAYVWIKYSSQEPTESSHSMGDIPDDWIGIYYGNASTAPTDWQQYKWFKHKGEQGDKGDPATLVSTEIVYQSSDSGTIIPSGTWLTFVPSVPQGQYLWTRITQHYNSGNPVVSYSVSRFGIDGTGSVSSVADVSPDSNGNVPLTPDDIGADTKQKYGKLVVFGDSIGQGENNSDYSFVDILSASGVFGSVVKACVSGATIGPYQVDSSAAGYSLVEQIETYASDVAAADIIMLEYGGNDVKSYIQGAITMGSYDDAATATTVCGYLKKALDRIRGLNATARIVWLDCFGNNYDSAKAMANTQYADAWLLFLATAIRTARPYLLGVIQIYKGLWDNHMSSDGIHPNTSGHTQIASKILSNPLGANDCPVLNRKLLLTGDIRTNENLSLDGDYNTILSLIDAGVDVVAVNEQHGGFIEIRPSGKNSYMIQFSGSMSSDTKDCILVILTWFPDGSITVLVEDILGAVRKAAHRNLLDNSDFRNPVNQRGQTIYNASGYTIDRWRLWSAEHSVTVVDGVGVKVDGGNIVTYIDANTLEDDKKYTYAAKDSGGNLYICVGSTSQTANTEASSGFIADTDTTTYAFTLRNGRTWVWAALYEGEYTAATLPEYHPKGYGAELAECQRYYQVRSANNIAAVDMRPTMRLSSPTITSVTGGYAYSADL